MSARICRMDKFGVQAQQALILSDFHFSSGVSNDRVFERLELFQKC